MIMNDNLFSQLANLRKLFSEVTPDDPKVISDYAWTIVKVLLQHTDEVSSINARTLLADCIKLPLERPSKLYSTLLSAAVKVANSYPEFRFATFLKMWGLENLRPEDNERQHSQDGKVFPSLAEKTAKALAHSLLLHQEDVLTEELVPLLQSAGYVITTSPSKGDKRGSLPMLVTRIKQATGKDGRKYTFVTLTSVDGIEVETVSHSLQPSPLQPLPEGKRHYVNIGQLYNCLLRNKGKVHDVASESVEPTPSELALAEAYLSSQKPIEIFPTVIGYIEAIDTEHGHIHVYDTLSRHFVAPVQRFNKERAGDFVRFIPVIPQASKFKTAILQATVPSDSSEVLSVLREIRITHINKEKGYAAWELVDKTRPITEHLSPLQLSLGETSPSFTSGFLNLTEELSSSSSSSSSLYKAFIYLKRGKDKQKRPHVAKCIGA